MKTWTVIGLYLDDADRDGDEPPQRFADSVKADGPQHAEALILSMYPYVTVAGVIEGEHNAADAA